MDPEAGRLVTRPTTVSRDTTIEWIIERQDADGGWERRALAATSVTSVTEQARTAFEWYVAEHARENPDPADRDTFRLVEFVTTATVTREVIEP